MKIIDVYVVHTEGNEYSVGSPAWAFTNSYKAYQVSNGRGWWGGNAHVEPRKAVIIDDKCYLLDKAGPFNLDEGPDDILAKKAAAMAKLTPEERKLLGLK